MKAMNNFTGVFEVNSALKSAEVYRLDHTVKKLFKEKEELLKEVRGTWCCHGGTWCCHGDTCCCHGVTWCHVVEYV